MHTLVSLLRCRRAATAVEYGFVVSLIVIAMLASFKLLANQTVTTWDNINDAVTTAR